LDLHKILLETLARKGLETG